MLNKFLKVLISCALFMVATWSQVFAQTTSKIGILLSSRTGNNLFIAHKLSLISPAVEGNTYFYANNPKLEERYLGELVKKVDFLVLEVHPDAQILPSLQAMIEAKVRIICLYTCVPAEWQQKWKIPFLQKSYSDIGSALADALITVTKKKHLPNPKFGVMGCDFDADCRQIKKSFYDSLKEKHFNYQLGEDQDGPKEGAVGNEVEMLIGSNAIKIWVASEPRYTKAFLRAFAQNRGGDWVLIGVGMDADLMLATSLVTNHLQAVVDIEPWEIVQSITAYINSNTAPLNSPILVETWYKDDPPAKFHPEIFK